jgi:hypothetical protein
LSRSIRYFVLFQTIMPQFQVTVSISYDSGYKIWTYNSFLKAYFCIIFGSVFRDQLPQIHCDHHTFYTWSRMISSLSSMLCIWRMFKSLWTVSELLCLQWLCSEMSTRFELIKMGENEAALFLLLKTVHIITIVWLILLSFSRNYLVKTCLGNFGSEIVCSLNAKIIAWKWINVAIILKP